MTTETDNPIVKTTFNLYQSDIDWLKALAVTRGTTITYQLRSAIAMWKFLYNERTNGSTILIEKPDGTINQIIFKDV